jgi:hypothetical protein
MSDDEERRLHSLTFDQIKEIAEAGVDPNLPIAEKRKLYKDNFYRFMRDSEVYVPHVFQIIGQKLLDAITRSFENRKNTDPSDSMIHRYNTIDEYIDDDTTMRHNLYVNEEAELIFASLGDAMTAFGEREHDEEESDNYDVRPWDWYHPRRRIVRRRNAPTRRPQRRPRNTLFRGGKTSKKTKKSKRAKAKKTLKKKH